MGFHGMGGEGGEVETEGAVVVNHFAFPCEGMPAAQLPNEAGGAVGGMVGNGAVEEVFFQRDFKTSRLRDFETSRLRDFEILRL